MLDKRGWIKPIRGKAEWPFLKAESFIYGLERSFQDRLNIFSSKKSLEGEISRLTEEVRGLAVDQNQLSSCQEENEKLRKLLGAPLPAHWKFLPAKVISVQDEMVIDQGEGEGVKEEMLVVSEDVLVGKVVVVREHSALVKLPQTSGVKIPVVVKRVIKTEENQGEKVVKAKGLLVGQYGQEIILNRVLQEEDIQRGDLVVSLGEGGWGSDLVIGQIKDVLPKTAEIYRKARVAPFLEYKKLRIVFVVMNK